MKIVWNESTKKFLLILNTRQSDDLVQQQHQMRFLVLTLRECIYVRVFLLANDFSLALSLCFLSVMLSLLLLFPNAFPTINACEICMYWLADLLTVLMLSHICICSTRTQMENGFNSHALTQSCVCVRAFLNMFTNKENTCQHSVFNPDCYCCCCRRCRFCPLSPLTLLLSPWWRVLAATTTAFRYHKTHTQRERLSEKIDDFPLSRKFYTHTQLHADEALFVSIPAKCHWTTLKSHKASTQNGNGMKQVNKSIFLWIATSHSFRCLVPNKWMLIHLNSKTARILFLRRTVKFVIETWKHFEMHVITISCMCVAFVFANQLTFHLCC